MSEKVLVLGIEHKEYPKDPTYLISEYGHVYSTKRGKYLAQWVVSNKDNRKRTKITTNGRSKTIKVHQLVAEAYLGPRPEGYEVNHIDGDKLNNHYSNLEYISKRDNLYHALETGLHDKSFKDIWLISPSGVDHLVRNLSKFCRENNLTQANMSKVLHGQRPHHKGWKGVFIG